MNYSRHIPTLLRRGRLKERSWRCQMAAGKGSEKKEKKLLGEEKGKKINILIQDIRSGAKIADQKMIKTEEGMRKKFQPLKSVERSSKPKTGGSGKYIGAGEKTSKFMRHACGCEQCKGSPFVSPEPSQTN